MKCRSFGKLSGGVRQDTTIRVRVPNVLKKMRQCTKCTKPAYGLKNCWEHSKTFTCKACGEPYYEAKYPTIFCHRCNTESKKERYRGPSWSDTNVSIFGVTEYEDDDGKPIR